jgi:DNA topoisomerase I
MTRESLPLARLEAREAGLHYAHDTDPGIRRVRRGGGFGYVGPNGRPVRDARTLERIASLAVPPAWTDVWINADARGHLQATGVDARGRKQPRYHSRWRAVRDEAKFHRLVAFGRALPRLRARVTRDIAGEHLTRRHVIATIVRLLETTLVRVGNDEYARENHHYGLTTLRDGHVSGGRKLVLHFSGKGGKEHRVEVTDRRVAHIVHQCQHLPGQRLFQFVDADGRRHAVGSEDVNAYLHEVTGEAFTAKDFRTWAATVLALTRLGNAKPSPSAAGVHRTINDAVDAVARSLRNTRAVCRTSYIHPAVIRACEEGTLRGMLTRCRKGGCPARLHADEAVALRFLVARERSPGHPAPA